MWIFPLLVSTVSSPANATILLWGLVCFDGSLSLFTGLPSLRGFPLLHSIHSSPKTHFDKKCIQLLSFVNVLPLPITFSCARFMDRE